MGVGAMAHRAVDSPVLRMAFIEMTGGAMTGFGHVVPFIPLGHIRFTYVVHRSMADDAGYCRIWGVEGRIERSAVNGIKRESYCFIGIVKRGFA